MRDRHTLGEPTYAALLEMALLADERELPWSGQDHVAGTVEANPRISLRGSGDLESEGRPRSEGLSTQDDDLTAGVWWDCDSQNGSARGGTANVLDDAQLIRNVLPLALIFQCLPAMANSVKVKIVPEFLNVRQDALFYVERFVSLHLNGHQLCSFPLLL